MWNFKIDDVLRKLGYVVSDYDACIYFKMNGDFVTYIALYVDDFFVFSNSADDIEQFQSELRQQFKLKKLGLPAECLGKKLKRNALNGEIF